MGVVDTNGDAAAKAKANASSSPLLTGLVGASSFVRHNPRTDRFKVRFGYSRRSSE
jgi:hypothetical protein